jgi:ABC-type multidrug transport system ATPase subunit
MEEADTLCTRIGIMAQGKMCSLGSSTELKTRHGQGYRLSFTLKREGSEVDEALLRNELCPTATLIYSFAKSRVYLLPTEGDHKPIASTVLGPFVEVECCFIPCYLFGSLC